MGGVKEATIQTGRGRHRSSSILILILMLLLLLLLGLLMVVGGRVLLAPRMII
jgi:hypothetical protein